jgi:bifunctional non-homologous end joining protein LigD
MSKWHVQMAPAAQDSAATAARRTRSRRQYITPPMPGFIEFQHPKLVAKPPTGSAWLHEIKFDGYRLQVRVEGGGVNIFTRNGHDWTTRFPELAADAASLPDCILDGELCALDREGHPNFSALRAAISPGRTSELVLFVFDLPYGAGEDLRPYALETRKSALARLMAEAPPRLRAVEHFETGGELILRSACAAKLEGIVSKRWDAPYRGGRSDAWVKAKCRPSQELVIGGWKQEPGRAFAGLLVGTYQGDRLIYAGRLKTGFGHGATGLLSRLKGIETMASPFAGGDPPSKSSAIHWVRPELVAAAEIAEWTDSGKVRQASFKGLREDKDPREVRREQLLD